MIAKLDTLDRNNDFSSQDYELLIIKTYYSLLKSNFALQICTVSYVEYFLNS